MPTRIKICGITRPEDAEAAARLGADAIGLVFYPRSPRVVSVAQAQAIVRAVPPFVTVVALFVNPAEDDVRRVLDSVPVGCLQFHGDEPPEACERYRRPYIKAVRMGPEADIRVSAERYARACGLLLDAFDPDRFGGTGQRFDWGRIPRERARPVILAGGLDVGNVTEAVKRVRPDAVDVSGGVESAPGIKDARLIAAFVRGVRDAEGC